MTVSATSPTSTTQVSNTSANNSTQAAQISTANLNYNTFLTLMMQQMKNQDPTNPVDDKQMLAQLAAFSQVGQSIQTNATLQQVLAQNAAQSGAALIGHKVTSTAGGFSGNVTSIQITSSGTTAVLDSGKSFDISTGLTINS